MAKKISVVNQKGGVGKTDVCVNLASYLARRGKKVLIVDMDPQANATDYLMDIEKQKPGLFTTELLSQPEVKAKDAIIETGVKNLHLIPSNISLSTTQVLLASDVDMQFKLKQKLASVNRAYDYIFIDTPPSLGVLTINALAGADEIVIPVQVHYFALDGVVKLMDTMKAVKRNINKKLAIRGVVVTMYDRRNTLSAEVEEKIRSAFGKKVFGTMIPINVRLSAAPSHHKPICIYSPSSTGAKAYKKLAKEFLK